MPGLGHADIQTTLNLYGWVIEDAELRALADWCSFCSGWRGWDQLGFLIPGLRLPTAARLLLPAQRKGQLTAEALDEVVPTPGKWAWLAQRPPAQPVSPHLVDPAQLSLFEARRDSSCLAVGALDQLPSLTPAAALVEEFQQHARVNGSMGDSTATS